MCAVRVVRRLVALLAATSMLAGCGRIGFDAQGDARDTPRLALRYYDFDGVRMLKDALDSVRGAGCYPRSWDDGRTYCTPEAFGEVAYKDAACTQPVGRFSSATQYEPDAVNAVNIAHLWQSADQPTSTTEYYLHFGTGCMGPLTGTTYEIVDIPRTDLVEMVQMDAPRTGRFVARFWDGGGVRIPAGYFDGVLDDNCIGFASSTSPERWCVPSGARWTPARTFSDASCTDPVGLDFQADVPPWFFVYDDICAPTTGTLHPNLGVSPATQFWALDPTCTFVGGTTATAYSLGAPIEVGTLTRTLAPSSTRFTALSYVGDGLEPIIESLYDQDWSATCQPYSDDLGTDVRCLPSSLPTTTSYFTDAACTAPLELVLTACNTLKPGLRLSADGWHSVGGVHAAPLFTDSSGCVPYTPTNPLYDLGPIVDFTPGTGTLVTIP